MAPLSSSSQRPSLTPPVQCSSRNSTVESRNSTIENSQRVCTDSTDLVLPSIRGMSTTTLLLDPPSRGGAYIVKWVMVF